MIVCTTRCMHKIASAQTKASNRRTVNTSRLASCRRSQLAVSVPCEIRQRIRCFQGAHMAKVSSSANSPSPSRSDPQDHDGRAIGNKILRTLPKKECAQIFSSLEFVRLKLPQMLNEAGESIRSGYFMNEGLGSVLTVQPDGKSVEVGLIGKEGFVGLPIIFGFKTSALRVVTQADGTAYRVDVATLRKGLPGCPELEKQLQRFSMFLAMQSTQIAACNQLHDVEERLARWLVMSHDRI